MKLWTAKRLCLTYCLQTFVAKEVDSGTALSCLVCLAEEPKTLPAPPENRERLKREAAELEKAVAQGFDYKFSK